MHNGGVSIWYWIRNVHIYKIKTFFANRQMMIKICKGVYFLPASVLTTTQLTINFFSSLFKSVLCTKMTRKCRVRARNNRITPKTLKVGFSLNTMHCNAEICTLLNKQYNYFFNLNQYRHLPALQNKNETLHCVDLVGCVSRKIRTPFQQFFFVRISTQYFKS